MTTITNTNKKISNWASLIAKGPRDIFFETLLNLTDDDNHFCQKLAALINYSHKFDSINKSHFDVVFSLFIDNKNFQVLGRGAYSICILSNNNRVYKFNLSTTPDPWIAYAEISSSCNNPLFPTILSITYSDAFYVAEVEFLFQNEDCQFFKDDAFALIPDLVMGKNSELLHKIISKYFPVSLTDCEQLIQVIHESVSAMKTFDGVICAFDFEPENFLFRNGAQLVFNDPLA